MIKHKKPDAFYDLYERKGTEQTNTHYCPGCGHGNAHKLIAEVIDDLGIQDKVIFISPVGCSVFGYYYFDTGNVQASHGRAPAVATGLRRTLDDAIIISYQGDGDLAGIGMGSIVHAANRGENITVFFINNAIYGMTGGQMAPTTLKGQKTLTTPFGRDYNKEGGPIGMAELLNSLTAPVFIERVSLATAPKIIKAKKAFRTALLNQVEKKGFSFVEVLSPCPINWKMGASESRKWIEDNLEPIFPVKKFRDINTQELDSTDKEETEGHQFTFYNDKQLVDLLHIAKDIDIKPHEDSVSDQFIKIAGFGGQGVMSAGVLLANCANMEELHSSWLPSYGPEMRGGTANASIIISGKSIGSPVVDDPNVLIAMNTPSLDSFEDLIQEGGLIIVNSSIVKREVKRKDVKVYRVPATEIAKDAGLMAGANVVVITIYLLLTGAVRMDTLEKVLPLSIKKKNFIELNHKVMEAAQTYFKNNPL